MFESINDPVEQAQLLIYTHKGQWWGGSDLGSPLHELQKEKLNLQTPRQVEDALHQTLAPLVMEGKIRKLEVRAFLPPHQRNQVHWEVRFKVQDTIQSLGGVEYGGV